MGIAARQRHIPSTLFCKTWSRRFGRTISPFHRPGPALKHHGARCTSPRIPSTKSTSKSTVAPILGVTRVESITSTVCAMARELYRPLSSFGRVLPKSVLMFVQLGTIILPCLNSTSTTWITGAGCIVRCGGNCVEGTGVDGQTRGCSLWMAVISYTIRRLRSLTSLWMPRWGRSSGLRGATLTAQLFVY
jgi:hypothetical protein